MKTGTLLTILSLGFVLLSARTVRGQVLDGRVEVDVAHYVALVSGYSESSISLVVSPAVVTEVVNGSSLMGTNLAIDNITVGIPGVANLTFSYKIYATKMDDGSGTIISIDVIYNPTLVGNSGAKTGSYILMRQSDVATKFVSGDKVANAVALATVYGAGFGSPGYYGGPPAYGDTYYTSLVLPYSYIVMSSGGAVILGPVISLGPL